MSKLFRRVLVPHDFSEPATMALRVAADLAARDRGRLLVLHVLGPFYTGPAYPSEEAIAWTPSETLLDELRARLQTLVTRTLGSRGRSAVCRVVMGDPLRCILEAARGADAIVMATTGAGTGRLLIGSVAEKVVRHAPVPVLTVPTASRRRRAARRPR